MSRVALVTGVGGGVGRAAAQLFVQRGWQVVGTDINPYPDGLELAHFMRVDVGLAAVPPQLISELAARVGRLDALVNNAAFQLCQPLLATTVSDWDRLMAVNIRAPFLLAQAAHPLLKAAGGAIVNVSSVHALATSREIAAYATSKGALAAFTRVAALEWAADGIRVNAILPGAVDTPMLRAGLARSGSADPERRLRDFATKHPLGRIGAPAEIAQGIYFLADNESSSFMTGQTLVVDGGALARLSTE